MGSHPFEQFAAAAAASQQYEEPLPPENMFHERPPQRPDAHVSDVLQEIPGVNFFVHNASDHDLRYSVSGSHTWRHTMFPDPTDPAPYMDEGYWYSSW
jgi:hypothetical protein